MPISITPEIRRQVRAAFPSLQSSTVFLENAGGSQVPKVVADRMYEYLLSTYVQLGAGYPVSQTCTTVVDEAHAFVHRLVNATSGTVILGASTSALLRMLGDCYADVLTSGQEIIVAETGHEANVGPWLHLEKQGMKIRWWKVDPVTATCPLDDLSSLLNDRTAIVALPHVSNLLGDIVDIKAVSALAHGAGARVVADGVAYAPHRAIDVTDWDVDWYAYSTYKVYGPHMAALYGRSDAVAELTGPNHFFIPRDEVPYKFELGCLSHEGCAGILALGEYLTTLADIGTGSTTRDAAPGDGGAACDRDTIEKAFEVMTACELPLQRQLMDYLHEKPGVRIVGPQTSDDSRVGTISFVWVGKRSADITKVVDESGIGIRHGHMYAHRLCEAVGLDPDDGVVRVSLVHYNTPEEMARLIEVLDGAM